MKGLPEIEFTKIDERSTWNRIYQNDALGGSEFQLTETPFKIMPSIELKKKHVHSRDYRFEEE